MFANRTTKENPLRGSRLLGQGGCYRYWVTSKGPVVVIEKLEKFTSL